MNKIFIYYSLTGNGDIVANYLRDNGVDIRKVTAIDKMPRGKVGRILTGGFLASIGYKAKLINFNNDVSIYDEVIIGSPIWNGRLSCPINSVLKEINLDNKKVVFILYSGSGKSKKATKKINKKYPGARIIDIKEPKDNLELLEKIQI